VAVVNITIDYDTYVAAMAAMLEQDAMAVRMSHDNERWTRARKVLKAAMLEAVSREIEESVPVAGASMFHIRQAG
jgi:hypothetical protein